MKTTTFHPFRSEQAKEEYLKSYDKQAERWPVPSQTRMINTSFGQTFVRISGPDNAQPLILLPPAAGNSLSWLPYIKTLSAHYQTYAVDNIYDYGRSIYTRPVKSATDFVNWLDELLNDFGFEKKIHLMGMSYGGWLTTHYALRFPHKLDKVVLIAPICIVLPLSLEFRIRSLLSSWPLRYFTKSFILWISRDLIKQSSIMRKIMAKYIDGFLLVKKYFKPKWLVAPSVLGDRQLQNIKIPMLYVVGENEKAYSVPQAVERLHKIAPQIKTEVIPDVGHDLIFFHTETVDSKILNFLQA
jgi:pimeloyl-ACP methyl ester carboxylesterase